MNKDSSRRKIEKLIPVFANVQIKRPLKHRLGCRFVLVVMAERSYCIKGNYLLVEQRRRESEWRPQALTISTSSPIRRSTRLTASSTPALFTFVSKRHVLHLATHEIKDVKLPSFNNRSARK